MKTRKIGMFDDEDEESELSKRVKESLDSLPEISLNPQGNELIHGYSLSPEVDFIKRQRRNAQK